MSNSVETRTALVTGATSGIGYEMAKQLAQDGYDLVLVARNKERLDRLADELGRNFKVKAFSLPNDLSIPSSPAEIFNELMERSIHIDILVNNAGFNVWGPFTQTEWDKELQMIQVNMITLTHLTKLILPGMVQRSYGKILNIGSTGSFAPAPLDSVYCATKAYVLSFSEAVAEEVRGTGVTVTALCPGATNTEFAARAEMMDVKLFQGSLMAPETVAAIGYKAMMLGKPSVVAGWANKATVFSLRFMPRRLMARMVKGMMAQA